MNTEFPVAAILLLMTVTVTAIGQVTEPWTSRDLLEPAALANMILGSGGQKPPAIFNFRSCPNIRPAFMILKEQGYTNPRLLNLKQNLKVDWTDYGYPMN